MIEGDEKVRARCLIDGITKSFSIDKISIVNEDVVITHSTKYEPTKKYYDIMQLGSDLIEILAQKPLYVNIIKDGISIHKVWKNGKPHKGSIIAMAYYEFTSGETCINEYGEIVQSEVRLSPRPWNVWGTQCSNSFKYFDKSANYFLENLLKIVD
jgi:hypothetical protein